MGHPTYPDRNRFGELPASKGEAESIAGLFGAKAFLDDQATEKRAKDLMGGVRFVHFATHGELDADDPLESFVVLAAGGGKDGFLHASELLALDLRAELVVLSACETGKGQALGGEGTLGLSWALFVAGSPSCLLTQWSVASDTTSRAMADFYRRLVRGKAAGGKPLSTAEALRQSQCEMLANDSSRRPYYWAPFTLIGDWSSAATR